MHNSTYLDGDPERERFRSSRFLLRSLEEGVGERDGVLLRLDLMGERDRRRPILRDRLRDGGVRERRLGGVLDRRLGGVLDRRLGGVRERRLGGVLERRLGGVRERRRGLLERE